MRTYSIGLYEKAMPNALTLREKLQCTKDCGYDYLELSIDATEEKIARVYQSQQERAAMVHAMQQIGVRIDSFCVSALTKYALGDPDVAKRMRGMDILQHAIVLAYDLGVRLLMIPGYDVYYGTSTAQTKAHYVENLRMATAFAAQYGVVLAFETMENDFMNTTQKAMEYVRLVQSPYLQVYPDCGNITNAVGQAVCDDLRTGAGHMVALHLKETLPNRFRETPYGTGHVNFAAVIATAWQLGIRKYVTELWDTGKQDWQADILDANTRMRKILEKAGA